MAFIRTPSGAVIRAANSRWQLDSDRRDIDIAIAWDTGLTGTVTITDREGRELAVYRWVGAAPELVERIA